METRHDKKLQFAQTSRRRWPMVVGVLAILLVAAGGAAWQLRPGGSGAFATVAANNGLVTVSAAALKDGRARFYRFDGGGQTVDFFVVRSADGVVRAALDTCDVCYQARKGYRQEGNFMVCNNCDQQFRTDLVNEISGGCNPAPLAREVRDGQVLIRVADLEAGRHYFAAAN